MIKFKDLSEKTADEIIATLEILIKDEVAVEQIRASKPAIIGTIDRALGHFMQEVLNDS